MPADFEISPLITPPPQSTVPPAQAPVSAPQPFNQSQQPSMPRKNNQLLKWLILVAAGLIVLTVGALWWGGSSFSDKDVVLLLEAPSSVTSGDEIVYRITYTNNTKLVLSEMSFRLFYPAGSIVMKDGSPTTPESEGFVIDSLEPGQTQTKELKIFMVGDKGAIRTAKLNLIFKAGSLRSSFQKEVTAATTISSLPVTVTLVAPPTTVSGQPVQYIVDVRNDSAESLSDLKLTLTYPEGLAVQSTRPDPSSGASWDIASLDAGEGKRFTITGTLSGNERETKTVSGVLQRNLNGQYVDFVRTEAFTVISSPLLSVTVMPSGGRDYVAFPGETLRYSVTYTNNSRYTLLGMLLGIKLEGEMFDTSRLQSQQGFYNDATKTLVFDPAGVPDFSSFPPSRTGKLDFTVPLKPGISGTAIGGAQSFYVKATARLSTANVPTGIDSDEVFALDSVITKIGAQPSLAQAVLYDAPFGAGPLPPTVGSETTFTVRWQLTNPGNDIKNATVTASLPPGVTFKGNAATVNGTAPVFDSISKKITWKVGSIPFATGNGAPRFEATFQVAITPASNQLNTSPKLIIGALLTGTDGFTGQAVEATARDVTTGNIENHENEGKVQ